MAGAERSGRKASSTPRTSRSGVSGAGAGSAPGASGGAGAPQRAPIGWRGLFNPLWCYHGLRMAVAGLTVFGLIMVFSSSVATNAAAGVSPLRQLLSQGIYCLLGLIAGFVCAMLPTIFYQRLGFPILLAAMGLQALTFTPLGWDAYGNAGWISIAGQTFQPAEAVKLALCIWLPSALSSATKRFERERHQGIKELARDYAVPVVAYALCVGLVLGGKDLGTCLILFFIGLVAFLVGGFPLKWLALAGGVAALGVGGLIAASPNRLNRLLAAYTGCTDADAQSVCYQSIHARYAMASGGFLGVGLGNSREKWDYLPAAHNDFIFAIIGEETGFVGAAIVVLLFAVLAWCMIVMALRIDNRYVSMVLMCLTVWLVGQALVNIGVVVGIFPVLGVPMPFVSAGGSSMVMCLMGAGVAVALMRAQPQVKADASKV